MNDWLANWGPMLLLIAVWIFFMLQFTRKNSPAKQSIEELRRHNDALEKLLAGHEERLRMLEDDKRRG